MLDSALASALTAHYAMFAARTKDLVDGLSEGEFWTRPYPYGNSVGHLLLHITGNLNYYIGAQIGGTGYVRDREREFTETARRPKDDVLADLDAAVAVVTATVGSQTAEDWARPYSAVGTDEVTRVGIVIRCAGHFHHHLGQIIYLVKEHARRRE